MKNFLITVASLALLWGLMTWDGQQGNTAPKWLYFLAGAPLLWVRTFGTDRDEPSETSKGLGLFFLFAASIFLMIIGAIGTAMPGTWGEILASLLPMGAVGFGLALLFVFFGSRN